jgi:DNA-binding transcriptional MerR regulator
MFRIGEFSRLTMIPVSALRYYADQGLLEPARVDPESGYRYFAADQMPAVNRLLVLKDLGLSLEEIRAVLSEDVTALELRGMLRLKRAEIGRRVAEERARLDRVEARLTLIEKEGAMPDQEIVVKQVEGLRGVGIRETLPGTGGFAGMIGDVLTGVMAGGMQMTGPPVTVYHDPEVDPEAIDVEFVVPVAEAKPAETPAGRKLVERSLCAAEMAVTVHVGPYETIAETYQTLAAWVGEQGLRPAGPVWEIYLTGPDEPGPPVTEIRIPVED